MIAAQHPCPESGQHQGFRAVDDNLVNRADHDVRLSTAQFSRIAASGIVQGPPSA
jgi:hypothetical protein